VYITVNVKEIGKQGIWFTSGSGEIGGGSLGVIYNAINLLGLGELLSLEATAGPRTANVILDLLMRRFLDSRVTLGLSLFRRFSRFDTIGANAINAALVKITRKDFGVRLSGSYPLTELSSVGVGFQAESVVSNDLSTGLPGEQHFTRRALTFNWNRDSTDHPLNPHRGQTALASLSVSGGILGGDMNLVKPHFEYRRFEPDPLTNGRNTWAFRAVLSQVSGFGGRGVPVFERFFSDGNLVRGFGAGEFSPLASYKIPVISVSKLGEAGALSGISAIGGDSLAAVQTEYRIPVGGSLSFIPFFDAGVISALHRLGTVRVLPDTNSFVRTSTGVELRFQLPIINRPLRLILAFNPTRLDKMFLLESGRMVRFKEKAWRVRPVLSGGF
jgi:outer membrane protein insertion porin family